MPNKPSDDLKSVMITCHKCGWSYSSRKYECPMCGAKIKIKEKELVGFLQEYIDRQGVYASKKECENFFKNFKKKRKRLPTMDELWKASLDYVKMEKMTDEELKKERAKKRREEDIKDMQAKLKQKRIEEIEKKRSKKTEPQKPTKTESVKSISTTQKITSSPMSKPKQPMKKPLVYENPSSSGMKFLNKEQRLANLRAKKKLLKAQKRKEKDSIEIKQSNEIEEKKITISDGFLICPECGTKNPPGSKFCLEDGTPLD